MKEYGLAVYPRRKALVIDPKRCDPKCGWRCLGCPFKKKAGHNSMKGLVE